MSTSVIPGTRAAFVIYKDEPTPSTRPRSKSSSTPTSSTTPSLSRTLSSSSLSLGENAKREREPARIAILTAGDKENVDPLTGRRPCLEEVFAKKRKPTAGNVLATKIVISKSKVLKDTVPELKKRKVLASSSPSSSNLSNSRGKSKSGSAAVAGSGSGEKERKRRSSKVKTLIQKAPLELPRVIEEDEDQADEKEVIHILAQDSPVDNSNTSTNPAGDKHRKDKEERVAQALVDSRCYELTVLPLADVSTAYCQSHTSLDDDVGDGGEVMTTLDEEIVAAGEKLKSLFTVTEITQTKNKGSSASLTGAKEQLASTNSQDADLASTLPSTPKSKSSPSNATLNSTPGSDSSPTRNSLTSFISSLTAASTPTRTPPLRRTLFPSFSYSPSPSSPAPSAPSLSFTTSIDGSPSRNSISSVTSSPSTKSTTSTPPTTTFSTPERARIYSAFTFSSPSLAGRRYAVTRGSAVSGLSGTVKIGDGAFSEGGVFSLLDGNKKSQAKVFGDLEW